MVVVVGSRVVVVAVADAVAGEGRRFVEGGSRWLDLEVVGSKRDSGYKVVVVVAAEDGKNVSFVFR